MWCGIAVSAVEYNHWTNHTCEEDQPSVILAVKTKVTSQHKIFPIRDTEELSDSKLKPAISEHRTRSQCSWWVYYFQSDNDTSYSKDVFLWRHEYSVGYTFITFKSCTLSLVTCEVHVHSDMSLYIKSVTFNKCTTNVHHGECTANVQIRAKNLNVQRMYNQCPSWRMYNECTN